MFLDYVSCRATPGDLLDPAYDALLTDPERRLRKLLEQLAADAGAEIRQTAAWQRIDDVLKQLGAASPSHGQ